MEDTNAALQNHAENLELVVSAEEKLQGLKAQEDFLMTQINEENNKLAGLTSEINLMRNNIKSLQTSLISHMLLSIRHKETLQLSLIEKHEFQKSLLELEKKERTLKNAFRIDHNTYHQMTCRSCGMLPSHCAYC
jgi:hypothetical protein